jgi:hypothetical protein
MYLHRGVQMANGKVKRQKKGTPAEALRGKYRNFPKHTLKDALVLAQKIQDEMGGEPMNRLLLAQAIGISPSSTNFRDLLSSAYKYGFVDGTEKQGSIGLGPNGAATQAKDAAARIAALRRAALAPQIFGEFFRDYANKKLPSSEMLPKILTARYKVPPDLAAECASIISDNGTAVDIIRDIGGSAHVLLDAELERAPTANEDRAEGGGHEEEDVPAEEPAAVPVIALPVHAPPPRLPPTAEPHAGPKPIFVGHGKNKGPLQQLQQLLTTFQIPHKVVVDEPNLGRPIPQKVKETIEVCGSAILIFTRDEKFFDQEGNEIWRPSENVAHELGATSYVYGDRIVIFKEKGLHFPSNFQSIGYIEFDANGIQARTAELLKELIGFGLVKVTPTQ